MESKILKRLNGSELLMMSILGNVYSQGSIDNELDRRALHGPPAQRRAKTAVASDQSASTIAA
ncbi:hypothetical protein LCGC14_2568900 [marine sediment metagenome]|uniref:Uncharacterized protein n=1 Tax=marine sediment metagenome TaxID=412755 RepID=A0A0F9CTW0_9ZZZZ